MKFHDFLNLVMILNVYTPFLNKSKILTNHGAILLGLVLLDGVQDGDADRWGQGIAAERVKVQSSVWKLIYENFLGGFSKIRLHWQ